MKKFKILILGIVLFIIIFSLSAYIKNWVTGMTNLPESVQRDEKLKEAYLFAKENPSLLEQLPCYCGCDNLGHKNNKDCYFDEEGNVIDHASMCGGCYGITIDAKRMYEEGKDINTIKEYIIQKYGTN